MDLGARLGELQKRVREHREVLLTEEAAKTALVMPFLQSLGYDVFNPGEVVPEYTADIGTKKGEKVDYAVCLDGKLAILIECKPASAALNLNHAGQLFRYFSVTTARLAVLTNGVVYQFYSDLDAPNKMDDVPFFTFSMEQLRPGDTRTIEKFAKANFNMDKIVEEARSLKLLQALRRELEAEFAQPSDDFVRLMAGRVYQGRLTPGLKADLAKVLPTAITTYVRDLVTERLSSALNATEAPPPAPTPGGPEQASTPVLAEDGSLTTDEEMAGFRIVQAIAARHVAPKRVVMRDAKSYCAILLDDNNRKSVARLHFNALTAKYLGLFSGKTEERILLSDLTDIYQYEDRIAARLKELESGKIDPPS